MMILLTHLFLSKPPLILITTLTYHQSITNTNITSGWISYTLFSAERHSSFLKSIGLNLLQPKEHGLSISILSGNILDSFTDEITSHIKCQNGFILPSL